MGPKNGHMTQEVLIRVFPDSHTHRGKFSFFLQGLWKGKLRMAGGQVEDAYLAEDEVRLALRGRKCLWGSGERKETGKERRDLGPGHRELSSPSAECSAYRRSLALPRCLWLALQNPLKCEARTGLSCLPVQTLGHNWCSMNFYLINEEWRMSERMTLRTKKSHRGNPLFASI